MPTYKVKDPETGKTVSLTGDSPPTEQELNDVFSKIVGNSDSQSLEQPKQPESNIRETISKIARPTLEIGGGIVGASIAAPTTPIGQAAAGALGMAGGKAAADLLDRIIGVKEPLPDMKSAVKEAGADVQRGMLLELTSRAGQLALSKGVNVAREFLKENAPKVSQALTGVNKNYFSRVANKPSTVLPEMLGGPKSLESAGQGIEAAENRSFGEAATPTAKEINDPALSVARKNALNAAALLEKTKGLPEEAQAAIFKDPEVGAIILKGRRGTQAQLSSPGVTGSKKALLSKQADEFGNILGKYYPEVKDALGDYGASKARSEVMRLLPVLKSGDPSVSRIVLAALGKTAGLPLGLSVPAVHAVTTALGSASLKTLEAVAGIPALRQIALEEISRRGANAQ
jgi:hypothetical protein